MSASGDVFESALAAEGVTGSLADLARSIYKQESGSGKNTTTSNAGAVGGMQIIPGTFKEVADKDWSITDPLHNARAGIRYIAKMHKLADGDPAIAAAGYYGGPGGLAKAKQGIPVKDPRNPNAPDTLQYGQQVASRVQKAVPTSAPVVEGLPSSPVQVYLPIALPEPVMASADASVGSDTWRAFLASMPQAQAETIQAADLNFGPRGSRRGGSGRIPSNITPNFAAFQGWKSRA